jgi:hypothetical protein
MTLTLALVLAHAQPIVSDDFQRQGTLDGSMPDVGADPWLAGSAWTTADGEAVIGERESEHAFVPFTPSAGTYYVLSAEMEPEPTSSVAWFALGFTQATGAFDTDANHWANFHEGGRGSAPWVLLRHDGNAWVARGPHTTGILDVGNVPNDRPTDVTICLDTRDADWVASFQLDGQHVDTSPYTRNPSIAYAAFGTEHNHGPGAVRGFRLEEIDPDEDGDGIPFCEDLCFGDDSTGDPDGNGICSDLDVEACDGIDGDGDGLADEEASCRCASRDLFGVPYQACRARVTRDEAAVACESWGRQLVQLETTAEHDAVTQALDIAPWAFRAWWIGLGDGATEGLYTWLDGTGLTDTAWGAGQPTSIPEDDCVGLFPSTGSWYERNCDALHGFVCEVTP